MVGLMGGLLLGIPGWMVAALPGAGFIVGIPIAIRHRKKKVQETKHVYEGSYSARRKLYD